GIGHDVHHIGGLVLQQDLAQHQLQGIQLPVGDVDHGGEVLVPPAYAVVQSDDRDDRDGQGQYDGQQQAEVGAAVHLGSLLQLQRDAGLEVGAHDDDVVHADSGGEKDG